MMNRASFGGLSTGVGSGRRGLSAVVLLGILIGVVVTYGPHLHNGFVWDDHPQIEQNAWVQGSGAWSAAFRQDVWAHASTETGEGLLYFRPLFSLVNRTVYWSGDGDPFQFHLSSLALHLLCIVLAFTSSRAFGLRLGPSLATAALFALHPLAAETVLWVGCLSEQLMLVFSLIALLGSLRARGAKGASRVGFLLIVFLSSTLACLAKETGIVVAAILTTEALTAERNGDGSKWAGSVAAWSGTGLFLALRFTVVPGTGLGGATTEPLVSMARVGYMILWDLKRLAFPFPLRLFHPVDPYSLDRGSLAVGMSTLLILGCLALAFWRRWRRGLFWMIWLILPLLPRLAQLFFDRRTPLIAGDRYLLMSLVPWCIVLVATFGVVCSKLGPRRRAALGVLTVSAWCLVSSIQIHRYGYRFRDDRSLFEYSVERAPGHPVALVSLAALEIEAGRPSEAEALLRTAIAAEPRLAQAHLNLGSALRLQGRNTEALESFHQAVHLDDSIARAHLLLGDTLRDLGRIEAASREWSRELEIDPGSVAARVNLGTYRYLKGDPDGAIRYWERALEDAPAHPDLLYNLGLTYQAKGDFTRAKELLQAFLEYADDEYDNQRDQAREWLLEMDQRLEGKGPGA